MVNQVGYEVGHYNFEVDEVRSVVNQSNSMRMDGRLIDLRNVHLAPQMVEACLDGHAEFGKEDKWNG